MLHLMEIPTGGSCGASGVACSITAAVLEMDGFSGLLTSIRNHGDAYGVAAFAADVARVIDRELKDIQEMKGR